MRPLALATLLFSLMTFTCARRESQNISANLSLALAEGTENLIQCVVEFGDDPDGHFMGSVRLDSNGGVFLDDRKLTFDGDAYPSYIMELVPELFVGDHTWKIDLGNGSVKEYEFTVDDITFLTAIPDTLARADYKVEVRNLRPSDEVVLFLSGDFSNETETYLEIEAQNEYFVIPESFIKQIDPVSFDMEFHVTRKQALTDDYFGYGVEVEWTKISQWFETRIQ